MTQTRNLLAVGLVAVSLGAFAQGAAKKVYIVQLADAPAATYTGGVGGMAATRPAQGAKLDAHAPNVRAYVNHLAIQHSAEMAKAGLTQAAIHHYSYTYNGFSALLTEAQAKALKKSAGVISVVESEVRQLDTTRTPGFLGISNPGGLWSMLDASSRPVKGEDVIIGMIDSGVWPENPSFGDKVDGGGKPVAYNQAGVPAYGPPPAKWTGACVAGPGFTAAMCNNKLIGARFYNTNFLASGASPTSMEYASPRDGGGHGTHTSSTAGGNEGVAAAADGTPIGAISGIAPRARLATYKVCWEATVAASTGCYTGDTLKAIDDAVKDGVDVINFSISGSQTGYDSVEIAYLNAAAAGVFVAASAGNSGPANQVAHISPWLTTVAASTHDRFLVAPVTLGAPSGASFSGPSYTVGVPGTPLVRSIDAIVGNYAALPQAQKTAAERCYLAADGGTANTALDPAKVAGKMVICYRGGNFLSNKAAAVKAAGGVALIIQNVPAIGGTGASNNSQVFQTYVVPTVHLLSSTYATINAFVLAQGAAASASFGAGVQQPGVVAPVMASFSSRGPNKANPNILKPDISGPGVDILAGYLDSSLTQAQHDALLIGGYTPNANATSLQGTSMSSPHLAGSAALLKQLHPSWSPAAIKSALMTTTTAIKLSNGTPDPDRWGYGAGHVNPNGAASPSLVYDAGPADYGRFLCGQGLNPPAGIGTCAALGSIAAQNLNLASMTAAGVPGAQTLTRRVTNVSGATGTFVASSSLAGGWSVAVSPASLTLADGASGNFSVTLTRAGAPLNTWSFGSLTWSDGVHSVVSPLSARAVGFLAPPEVSDTRASGSGTKVVSVVSAYTGTMSATATGLVPATRSLGSVITNAVQCFDFSVAAGAQLARFQLFAADTTAPDLDLTVFNGPGGTGATVGASGGGTSDEVVTLAAPTAGTYSACVTGYDTGGANAAFVLNSWSVGPAVGAQSLRVSVPSSVYAGGSASVALGWSVTAGKRYLGNVKFFDNTAALIGSTVVFVDNH